MIYYIPLGHALALYSLVFCIHALFLHSAFLYRQDRKWFCVLYLTATSNYTGAIVSDNLSLGIHDHTLSVLLLQNKFRCFIL